jgi:hypothetical protein
VSCAWLAAPIATTTISVTGTAGGGGDIACIARQPDHQPGEPRPDPFSRRGARLLPGLLATYPDGLAPAGDDEFVVNQLADFGPRNRASCSDRPSGEPAFRSSA